MGSTPTRPTRRKAFLRTRVRDDAGWSELTVHNVSEAGMMLQGKRVPQRGTIIEIRIGEAAIVAEVRWAVGNRCGVRSRAPCVGASEAERIRGRLRLVVDSGSCVSTHG